MSGLINNHAEYAEHRSPLIRPIPVFLLSLASLLSPFLSPFFFISSCTNTTGIVCVDRRAIQLSVDFAAAAENAGQVKP